MNRFSEKGPSSVTEGTKTPGVSTGLDMVSVRRIRAAADRKGFLARVFTPAELGSAGSVRYPERRLACIFAAKEACAKALGTGFGAGLSLREIEVCYEGPGRGSLRLSGKALKLLSGRSARLSMSSSEGLAIALVVVE